MGDSAIQISEAAMDRLRTLAEERGLSTRAYVERAVAVTPTGEERTERTAQATVLARACLREEVTEDDVRQAREWRAAIVAGREGSRR